MIPRLDITDCTRCAFSHPRGGKASSSFFHLAQHFTTTNILPSTVSSLVSYDARRRGEKGNRLEKSKPISVTPLLPGCSVQADISDHRWKAIRTPWTCFPSHPDTSSCHVNLLPHGERHACIPPTWSHQEFSFMRGELSSAGSSRCSSSALEANTVSPLNYFVRPANRLKNR